MIDRQCKKYLHWQWLKIKVFQLYYIIAFNIDIYKRE
jgi:hypothetical protein